MIRFVVTANMPQPKMMTARMRNIIVCAIFNPPSLFLLVQWLQAPLALSLRKLALTARLIEYLDKLALVKNSLFKLLIKSDGSLRTSRNTQVAEHALTNIIFILNELLFLLAVFSGNHLTDYRNTVVRASHLAETAGNTFMLVIFIVWHFQTETVSVCECQRIPVFGILFCLVVLEENLYGCFQSNSKALYSVEDTTKISFTVHNPSLFRVLGRSIQRGP